MIKAVLFDLGGVFFEDGSNKFIQILSEKAGRDYTELHRIFREGKSIDYRENKISGQEFFEYAAKELNYEYEPDDINSLWVSQYTEIKGIRELIRKLKENNIKVTVLSDNVPERIKYLETKYQFLELFDDVVLSYDVNLTKASAEIFETALKRISVLPEKSIFVDDREKNIQVAEKLGINTILFSSVINLKSDLEKYIGYNLS